MTWLRQHLHLRERLWGLPFLACGFAGQAIEASGTDHVGLWILELFLFTVGGFGAYKCLAGPLHVSGDEPGRAQDSVRRSGSWGPLGTMPGPTDPHNVLVGVLLMAPTTLVVGWLAGYWPDVLVAVSLISVMVLGAVVLHTTTVREPDPDREGDEPTANLREAIAIGVVAGGLSTIGVVRLLQDGPIAPAVTLAAACAAGVLVGYVVGRTCARL